jgi:hypothetical protein
VLIRASAVAKYIPSPDLPASSDNITAVFYPEPSNPPAALGRLTVTDPAGLFVSSQLATVWNDQMPSLRAY